MSLKITASFAVCAFACVAALSAGAAEPSPTPATVAPVAIPAPAQPAADGNLPAVSAKPSRPQGPAITVKAPIFSPLFAKTPLALVNDDPITMEDLKKALGTIHEGMGDEQSAPKRDLAELLNRLINSQLIIQEARSMELDKLEEVKKSLDEYAKKLRREILLNERVKEIRADEKTVEKIYRERTKEWRLKSLVVESLEDVKALESALKKGKSFDELSAGLIAEGKAREGGSSATFIPRDAIAPTMLTVLEKMKPGELSKPLPLDNGYLIYRLEETRSKDDPAAREQIRKEEDSKIRVKSLEEFQAALIKKHTTLKKKVFDKLNFENKKVKFETYLKDKRVLVEIKGEKPVTVAEFAEAIAAKFYHGVERAIEGGKVNKVKQDILKEMLSLRVFETEARARKIDENEEYRANVQSHANTALFSTFITKVVRSEVTATPEEIQAYYKEHATEYTAPGMYRLDALAFDTLPKAEEAVQKLRAGTEYRWLKTNADGQVSIDKNLSHLFEGNEVTFTDLPEGLQKALTGAANGDYRVFANGPEGYVVSVLEAQPAHTMPFAAVEQKIKERVFYDKLNKRIESWAERLRASSDVIVYADFAQQEKP